MAQLKLGNLSIKDGLILAPMAGVNDIAFRKVCKDYGAVLTYTGMVNANAFMRNNKSTERIAQTSSDESLVGVQFFGSNTQKLVDSVRKVEGKADIIDINFGCPDRNIIRQGAGSALLRRPNKVAEIVSSVKKVCGDTPLTIKIRSGIEKHNPADTLKISRIIQDSGADALSLHPRTTRQGYNGKADWKLIKSVKESLDIPVIASGDVNNFSDKNKLQEMTKCDAVMVGRAAIGNPFVFDRNSKKPDFDMRVDAFQKYLGYAKEFDISMRQVKAHLMSFFVKFIDEELKEQISKCETIDDVSSLFDFDN